MTKLGRISGRTLSIWGLIVVLMTMNIGTALAADDKSAYCAITVKEGYPLCVTGVCTLLHAAVCRCVGCCLAGEKPAPPAAASRDVCVSGPDVFPGVCTRNSIRVTETLIRRRTFDSALCATV